MSPTISCTTLNQPFVIAIGGPSSSGKTTLAYLLRAILQPFTRDVLNSLSSAPGATASSILLSRFSTSVSTSTSLSSTSQAAPQQIPIVHQDAFFVWNNQCPRMTYVSTDGDRDFVEGTVRQTRSINGRSRHVTSEDAEARKIRLNTGDEIAVGDGYVIQSLDADSGMYEVTGANKDCVDSIHWSAFGECVIGLLWKRCQMGNEKNKVKARGANPEEWEEVWRLKEKQRKSREGLASNVTEEQHKKLIEDMREHVKRVLSKSDRGRDKAREKSANVSATASRRQCFDRDVAIVEGFQLYPPRLVDPLTSTSATAIQTSLLPLYTMPLFLALPRAEMKARRFARAAYIDETKGGLRRGGEMWKTEGYFERVVATGGNERAIKGSWIIEVGEGQGETTVRVGDGGKDIREVVEWALEQVLDGLIRR